MLRTGPEALIGAETSTRSLAKTIAATRFLTMTTSDIVALVAETCLSNPTLGVTFDLDSPPANRTTRKPMV